jgi:uncharacterized protein (DUF2235 family)
VVNPAPKQIVVCLDGTWNQPEALVGVPQPTNFPTNIYRLWLGLNGPKIDSGDVASLLHNVEVGGEVVRTLIYIRGIGTSGWDITKLVAGWSGFGLSPRIQTAYRLLAQAYNEGDNIFVFGFSRGAMAARSLVGMIKHCGISKGSGQRLTGAQVKELYRNYQRKQNSASGYPSIEYIGLWDTVTSIPFEKRIAKFHDLSPSNVKVIRQALALDEFREEFQPKFWKKPEGEQSVTEAWFSGAHANIGGGYEKDGLSNIALIWILAGAMRAGLKISLNDLPAIRGEAVHYPHNSYGDFWIQARVIGQIVIGLGIRKHLRSVIAGQYFHVSVLDSLEEQYTPKATFNRKPITKKIMAMERLVPWEVDDAGQLVDPARSQVQLAEALEFRRRAGRP